MSHPSAIWRNQTPLVLNLPFWREHHTARNGFKPWSQQALADYVGVSRSVIAKLESGMKVQVDLELALRLAEAFSFNMLECERLLKATVFSRLSKLEQKVAHPLPYEIQPPQHCLEEVWQRFTPQHAPAILHDELYDLIGVNRLVMAFHGVDEATLLQMRDTRGANFLHFVFHPSSPLFASNPAAWEQFALNNLYQFRYFCLLLHHTQRCKEIFSYLDTLPRFRPLWNKALLEIKNPTVYHKPYIYRHAEWAPSATPSIRCWSTRPTATSTSPKFPRRTTPPRRSSNACARRCSPACCA